MLKMMGKALNQDVTKEAHVRPLTLRIAIHSDSKIGACFNGHPFQD